MTQPTIEHPRDLPESAAAAWLAYVNMQDSKTAHFEYLESLESKYAHGGRRTLAEEAHLAGLLETHHDCVQTFSVATKTLASSDPAAHAQFVALMTHTANTPSSRESH